jgi:hypothetical protein
MCSDICHPQSSSKRLVIFCPASPERTDFSPAIVLRFMQAYAAKPDLACLLKGLDYIQHAVCDNYTYKNMPNFVKGRTA